MKQGIFVIEKQEQIARDTWKLALLGDTSALTAPGQFVNIKLSGLFLRRPISVCDYDSRSMILIYKVVGEGTGQMSRMQAGEKLDILTGLGNGYRLEPSGSAPLLIGGGAGVPPLYHLCKRLIEQGKKPGVILGFNSRSEVFYQKEFEALGARVQVTTADGSEGLRGFVTNAMSAFDYTYFYACGPEPMLRAVYNQSRTSGQLSFEERMGCGFGACMGCSCKTKYGNKRICKDGPVLEKEEIIW